MFRRMILVLTMAGVIIAVPACNKGKDGVPNKTFDSPQKVFDAAVAAAGKEDWPNFMACLTEDSRDTMTVGVMFMAMFAKGFAEFDKEKSKDMVKALDDAMKKHGVTEAHLDSMKKDMPKPGAGPDRAAIKKLVEPIKDKPAFISDVMAAMKKMGDKQMEQNFSGELKDLKVDGDKATAKVLRKRGGKEIEEPIAFRKVDGGWKIELPEDPTGGVGPK